MLFQQWEAVVLWQLSDAFILPFSFRCRLDLPQSQRTKYWQQENKDKRRYVPTAYIAIGSNFKPIIHIQYALAALATSPGWRVTATSDWYRSAAVDKDGSAPVSESHRAAYVNAVVALDTDLPALEIRRRMRAIETTLGRDRSTPAQVAIDLDLIAIDRQIFDVDGHHLPDPSIQRHAFVAVPFWDVASDWVHPETNQPLKQIAAKLQNELELETVSP